MENTNKIFVIDRHKPRMVRLSVAIMMCLYSAAIGVLIAIGAFAAGGAW